MPKRRSAMARAAAVSSASACFRASKTAKSLPSPFIFRKAVIGGYIRASTPSGQWLDPGARAFQNSRAANRKSSMKRIALAAAFAAFVALPVLAAELTPDSPDPFLWLADIHGAK